MAAEKGRHCTAFYRGGKKLFAYFLSYDNSQQKCCKAGRGNVGRASGKEVGSRSVSRVLSLNSHSSSPAVTDRLKQPTRVQRGPRQCTPIWSCSGWGLACRPHHCVRGALLPRRGYPRRLPKESTFSPLPVPCYQGHRRFSSLFHFPSPRDAWPLASILPCGARTFLPVQARGDCLTDFPARIVPDALS